MSDLQPVEPKETEKLRKPKTRKMNPIVAWLLAVTAYSYLKISHMTTRWTGYGVDTLPRMKDGKIDPSIFVLWHGRLYGAAPHISNVEGYLAVLASTHKGADVALNCFKFFNIKAIRGSSRNPDKPHKYKFGKESLLLLREHLESSRPIAMTPDGPRGPCYKAQAGAAILAQQTGAPIIAYAWNSSSKWVSKRAWDRAHIILPFGRGHFSFSKPVHINPDLPLEEAVALVERTLNENQAKVDQYYQDEKALDK